MSLGGKWKFKLRKRHGKAVVPQSSNPSAALCIVLVGMTLKNRLSFGQSERAVYSNNMLYHILQFWLELWPSRTIFTNYFFFFLFFFFFCYPALGDACPHSNSFAMVKESTFPRTVISICYICRRRCHREVADWRFSTAQTEMLAKKTKNRLLKPFFCVAVTLKRHSAVRNVDI